MFKKLAIVILLCSMAAVCQTNTGGGQGGTGGGGGSVTSVSSGNLPPLFTVNVATGTSTPEFSFALSNFAADSIYGNFTGSSAAPSTQAIPPCANDGSHSLSYPSHTLTCSTITAGVAAGSGYYVPPYTGSGAFTMSASAANHVQGIGISIPAWTFSNIVYLVSTTQAASAVYGAALIKTDGTAVCHTSAGVQLTANGTGTAFPCAEGSVTIPAGNYILLTTGGSTTGTLQAVAGGSSFTFYYNLTISGCTATNGVFNFGTPCSITPSPVVTPAGPPLFMLQ